MATLAASSRPLKRDNIAAFDHKRAAEMLKHEGERFPWIVFVAVGADGRTVRSTLPADLAEKRIALTGGCVGFAGVLWFNKRLAVFTRPLRAGDATQKLLEEQADKMQKMGEELVQELLPKRLEQKR